MIQNRVYKIDSSKRLGYGAQGMVFECTCSHFPNEILCVKRVPIIICRNDFCIRTNDKAQRETDILKQIQHFDNPHLIKIKDIYEEQDHLHFVMEKINGGTLDDAIKKRKQANKRTNATEILDFIYQFCDGYSVLYDNNILHRDIKSDNVLIQLNETSVQYKVKIFMKQIADFGISKILTDMQQKANHTRLGTRAYMSPQLLIGQHYSSKADVYSFGILLHYFIFFQYPFETSEKQIGEFQKKLQQSPYKVQNLNIEGNFQQIQEIKEMLELTIQYEEKDRLDWPTIIQRIRSNPNYAAFNKNNQYDQKNQSVLLQQQELIKVSKEINPPKQKEQGIIFFQNVVNHQLSSFLKLQLIKKRLAQLVVDNFEEAINQHQFLIPQLDFHCYLASIYAYQFNLLKNMDSIYQRNYNNLSVQLQSVTSLQQFGDIIDTFRIQMNENDKSILAEMYTSLTRISQINKLKSDTTDLINKQKIRLLQLVQFRDDLAQLNYQTDYISYWKWVQYFEKSHLCKTIIINQNELAQKQDCVIFYLAYTQMFNQVELWFPQSNLVQFENEENFPQLNLNREKAMEIIQLSLWS